MKTSSGNEPIQTLTNRVKKNKILLTHKLQRREGVWSSFMKSLLIDSLFRGYIINPIHTIIDENKRQYIIDGIQRVGTIKNYLEDGFALSKKLSNITIDGKTYEIAGKKFSKLDEDLKDELISAKLQVYEITDYTDQDVREMFKRLNSGKALNSVQQMTPLMSDELSNIFLDIISHPFFEKILTQSQLKSSVDMTVALEVLMLSEASNEYDFGSFSKKDKEKFIEYYNANINEEKVNLIKSGIDELDKICDENTKIPKTSISFICYGYYRVLKDGKDTKKFNEIVKDFLDNYESNEEYKSYIIQGTNSKDSISKRLDFWRDIIRRL